MPDPAHYRAGYSYLYGDVEYEHHQQVILDTIDKLTDHYGVEVKKVRWNPTSTSCTAYYRDRTIGMGMTVVRHWAEHGYQEYKTLQYLLGVDQKRGEKREHSHILRDKAVQAIVCHEYAHLVCYKMYGPVFGRGHGIMFQQVVAEAYDLILGADFGATERFLKKNGKKWLEQEPAFAYHAKHKGG